MDQLIKYLPLALFILNALTAWACWSLRQLAKSEIAAAVRTLQEKDEAICEDVDEHDTKITKLEGRVPMPTEIRAGSSSTGRPGGSCGCATPARWTASPCRRSSSPSTWPAARRACRPAPAWRAWWPSASSASSMA